MSRPTTNPSVLGTAVLLAAGCFAAYWGWLGWDSTYQRDPVTGVTSGPYETWQVAGCVLTLAALALAAALRRQAWTAVAVMPPAFTVAWAVPASSDTTGLFLVSAVMIFIGMTLVGLVLALPAQHLRERLSPRHG